MPRKDLRYYARTIWLKSNAEIYYYLQKFGFLSRYQARQKKYFEQLYKENTLFSKNILSDSFSTIYVGYDFYESREGHDSFFTFDSDGVAMCRSDVKSAYYNPLLTGYYALVCYNDFVKNKNPDSEKRFWIQLNHLYNKIEENNFRFYYDWRGHHFYSGITQGIISSTFMRAYVLSKDNVWKKAAYNVLNQIFVPIEMGGNFTQDSDGNVWVEEYPKIERLSMVFNGFLYSLISTYEYLILCERDEKIEYSCRKMTESLFKTMHHFKFGKFTRYSRFSKVFENIDYEGRNYFLFKHLFELTGNQAFELLMNDTYKKINWKAFYRFIG